MLGQLANNVPLNGIAAFCQRWQIQELALFGSVLRADFSDTSDVDVLVRFHEGTRYTLFDLARMGDDLESLFQHEVDILDRRAVEQSPNYIRRAAILQSAKVVYAE